VNGWWALLISIALISFVAGQLLLKKGMEVGTGEPAHGRRHVSRFIGAGIFAMTISFFLTVGLLQRFDLSYIYPFQGFSVVLIALTAALILREKVTLPLWLGTLLISAGIVLVSLS
jgi:uncharacterized membrane protein